MQPMPYPPGMPPPAGELSLIAYHSLLACLSLCSYVFSRHESDATLVAVFIDNDIAYWNNELAYMPPPPPGAYPPPPNGAGPRPSMPPTPIPTHAHPYYHHQSPQRMQYQSRFDYYRWYWLSVLVQHAVPYPMMMQPPSGVPHPYENGPPPPVQMGGHAWKGWPLCVWGKERERWGKVYLDLVLKSLLKCLGVISVDWTGCEGVMRLMMWFHQMWILGNPMPVDGVYDICVCGWIWWCDDGSIKVDTFSWFISVTLGEERIGNERADECLLGGMFLLSLTSYCLLWSFAVVPLSFCFRFFSLSPSFFFLLTYLQLRPTYLCFIVWKVFFSSSGREKST